MSNAALIAETRDKLRNAPPKNLRVIVGLDGFVDEIIHPVDQRYDLKNFSRIKTISAFAARLAAAAGKSVGTEWVVDQVKIGGNGPLMCLGLCRLGAKLLYVGAVGNPAPEPVFDQLREFGDIVTLAAPGYTHAVEFEDGKIMFGKPETMNEVTWPRIVEKMGGEDKIARELSDCDLVALTNWTMLPFVNSIYEGFWKLSLKGGRGGQAVPYFFDLADPERRTREDLTEVVKLFGRASAEGHPIILGLNFKESQQIAEVLKLANIPEEDGAEAVRDLAARIQKASGITEIVIHPRHRAAAATKDGAWVAEGPFCAKPRLSTGAGDHFNGGYCYGRLRGLAPQHALVVGTANSGYYVRNAKGPTLPQMDAFLDGWSKGAIPEPKE